MRLLTKFIIIAFLFFFSLVPHSVLAEDLDFPILDQTIHRLKAIEVCIEVYNFIDIKLNKIIEKGKPSKENIEEIDSVFTLLSNYITETKDLDSDSATYQEKFEVFIEDVKKKGIPIEPTPLGPSPPENLKVINVK